MRFLPHDSVFSDHNYVEHIETYYVIYVYPVYRNDRGWGKWLGDFALRTSHNHEYLSWYELTSTYVYNHVNSWGDSHLEPLKIIMILNNIKINYITSTYFDYKYKYIYIYELKLWPLSFEIGAQTIYFHLFCKVEKTQHRNYQIYPAKWWHRFKGFLNTDSLSA